MILYLLSSWTLKINIMKSLINLTQKYEYSAISFFEQLIDAMIKWKVPCVSKMTDNYRFCIVSILNSIYEINKQLTKFEMTSFRLSA